LRLAASAQQTLPQRAEPEDTLGWVYYRKGDAVRAIEALDQAVTRAPEKPVYHDHLGLARLKARQIDQGRSALQRALALGLSGADGDNAKSVLAR